MKPFFAYMLRCRDGSFYVGHTDELETRIAQHDAGTFGGHTARKRPVTLAWSTEFETRDEALVVEMRLKGWSRGKKEALIRGDWDQIRELSRPRTGPDLRRGKQEEVPAVPVSLSNGHRERSVEAASAVRQAHRERDEHAVRERDEHAVRERDEHAVRERDEHAIRERSEPSARPELVEGPAPDGSHA